MHEDADPLPSWRTGVATRWPPRREAPPPPAAVEVAAVGLTVTEHERRIAERAMESILQVEQGELQHPPSA